MKYVVIQRFLPKSVIDYILIGVVVFVSLSFIIPSIGLILFPYKSPPKVYDHLIAITTFYITPFVPEDAGIGAFFYYFIIPVFIIFCLVICSFLLRIFTKRVNPLSILVISIVLLLMSGILFSVESYLSSYRFEQDLKVEKEIGQQMKMRVYNCHERINENDERQLSCSFSIQNAPYTSENDLVEITFNSDEFLTDATGFGAVSVPLEKADNGELVGSFNISETDYSLESMYISVFTYHDFDSSKSYPSSKLRLKLL